MQATEKGFRFSAIFFALIVVKVSSYAQDQSCPANINFASGDISNWSAQTGLVGKANLVYPAPNADVSVIPEYSISTAGIKVIKTASNDPFGGFSTIPTINGYAYGSSIQIGSSSTSYNLNTTERSPGGFTRSVTYTIAVPAGPATLPYTMTYAYAMVLENGTHNSDQQPLFKATLSFQGSVISCASPSYFLPTLNNAVGGNDQTPTGATLDSAGAKANGFKVSPLLFLSHAGQGGNSGTLLQDVWTKAWTEVTFDLSSYRGQQVTLTFEADNCTPGAHFAYAYVALRNDCGGLEISGPAAACSNTVAIYSIPALANASYSWTVPAGWQINSGANTNTVSVTPGVAPGVISVHEVNGCADLKDTINVSTLPPTVAGRILDNNTVCAGSNSTILTVTGQTGNVLNWVTTTDGTNFNPLNITTNTVTITNLQLTTVYRAIVQNGPACKADTSQIAIITVDPKTVAGSLSPALATICAGQDQANLLTLQNNTGAVVNWQSSPDSISWTNFLPVKTDSIYRIGAIHSTIYYRTVIKSGSCPEDTSNPASIRFINVPFPAASVDPTSQLICYGKTATLHAVITNGTGYTWTNNSSLTNQGNGLINSLPLSLAAIAAPVQTTGYILTVNNAGCPNPLNDTFHVAVTPRIIVFAGNDTSIVSNQPLQLNAVSNDPLASRFSWTPATGLNFSDIYNPIANLGAIAGRSITFLVRATSANGCYGEDNIKVTVFVTLPDIFVPSAFTPNNDGKNDVLKPICVGITRLNYFRIFNRWGQLIFSTSEIGKGWDGTIAGSPQATAGFVYLAQGIDFTGRTISRKGNIVLIR